mgnify:CR=1 FL=1
MSAIEELRQTIARLRGPGGCPWDQEQTHATLVRCLIDEASELIDTIDRGDYPHMREELGDVLIQVIFHALIAQEGGHSDFDDVARDAFTLGVQHLQADDVRPRRHPFALVEAVAAAGGDAQAFNEIMMPLSLALADRCDACLRIGGPSKGADDEVERFQQRGQTVFYNINEVPRAN